jgi:predicted membrane protein (TIGR00267 family)
MFRTLRKKQNSLTVREVVFGLEDGLVSTLGAITGIAAGINNAALVILSGLVILAVESSSMGAGSYLSNKTAELTNSQSEKRADLDSVRAGLTMVIAYLAGGVVPLFPYFFLPPMKAIPLSVVLTIIALAGVGIWTGVVTKYRPWKSALEMVVVSFAATVLGYIVGRFPDILALTSLGVDLVH